MKHVRLLYCLFLWTWRCTTLSNVPIILILGSLSNDDGDVNKNGKKAVGLDWQNNVFITLFCTFPYRHCTTTMWKCLYFTFCRGREHQTTTFFFFSWTSIHYFRTQLQKKCQHLTNWTRWNKHDKVWSRATSLFQCHFRGRRRRCCLSSHLLTKKNVVIIYSATTKDRALSGSFQHKLQHVWCLSPSVI